MLTPTVCVAPVRSHRKPITISWLAAAGATLACVVQTATASPSKSGKLRRIARLLSLMRSVREGPDPEVVPDISPEAVQPFRLDDQEKDDQRPEEDEPEVRDDVEDRRLGEHQPAERLHGIPDDDRQQRHEDRAEDGAEHRAQAPDDDHGQVVDRDRKSTRLNSSHTVISYAVFCLKKKNIIIKND